MKIKLFITAICLFAVSAFVLNAKEAEIKIKTNMHCKSCVTKIEDGLKTEAGVSSYSADLKSKMVTIKFDDAKTNSDNLKKVIAGLGFDACDVKEEKNCDTKSGGCCSTKDKKAKTKKS